MTVMERIIDLNGHVSSIHCSANSIATVSPMYAHNPPLIPFPTLI